MITEVLIAVAAGTFGLSAYLNIRAFPAWRQRRTLRRATTLPIGELPEGTIGRLIGTVHPAGRTLSAPLTGRECVCWLVWVDAGSDQQAYILIYEQKAVRFILDDGSGRALIEPAGADIEGSLGRAITGRSHAELKRRNAYERQTGGALTEQEHTFLADRADHLGKRWRSSLLNSRRSLTFHEEVVEIGETICVAGAGIREGDPDASPGEGYRTEPPTRLRFTSSPKLRLLITDAPSKR